MKLLDKKTSGDLVRLLVFVVITTLATAVLVILIGNLSFQSTTTFRADFANATGVVKGDDVRVAGVKVGSVKDIEIIDGSDHETTHARITFTVADGTPMTGATHATIRYRNLVGQRYISLTQDVGDAAPLKEDALIPMSKTAPALNLTMLFNGFKPLFQALTPDDLNKLSYEVVQVFQGEGGTLESLLQSTASLTNTLADRDQIIGQLLDNLDYVLDHIADRDTQLTALIKSFRRLVGGLKDDREAILGSLDQISDLSVETADLAQGIRPPFVEDIKQLRRFAATVDANKAELDRQLQVLPIKLKKIGRTAIYGSWFNFFLCDFHGRITAGSLTLPVHIPINSDRCDLGG